MNWTTNGSSHSYAFSYDGLNRLLNATHGTGRFTEKVTSYDKNGNIKGLQRYGQTGASTYGLIDNLTYTLDGNRLNRVDDAVSTSAYNDGFEFKDGVKQANEYAYDANGNLTKDLNKGISSIQYNYLNLPTSFTYSSGGFSQFGYTADGVKRREIFQNASGPANPSYIVYCGNVIYENNVAKLLITEEGYVTLSNNTYHYYVKDHQGNNRLVVNSSGAVEEVNHYYPFGGLFANSTSVQPYKYNGKELNTKRGVNWYDYGARQYDAALGRFTTNDRFAEKYYSMSTYQYGANNPVNNIDINGDSIGFSTQYKDGKLSKVTMHVTGKVLNDSKENINMETAAYNISTAIKRAYKGEVDGVDFDADIQLSSATNMTEVLDSDHLFVLTDRISDIQGGKIYGASNYMGGKVAFIDVDTFLGIYDEALGSRNYGSFTAAHEFGHLAGLEHSKNPFNIMRSNGMFYNINSPQLRMIYNKWRNNKLNYGTNYMYINEIKRPNVGNASVYVKP